MAKKLTPRRRGGRRGAWTRERVASGEEALRASLRRWKSFWRTASGLQNAMKEKDVSKEGSSAKNRFLGSEFSFFLLGC
eukprot:268031-Hanusia_phi.AAC.3